MILSKGNGTGPAGPALAVPHSKEIKNIFQLTKNQIKWMVKNRAGIERLWILGILQKFEGQVNSKE